MPRPLLILLALSLASCQWHHKAPAQQPGLNAQPLPVQGAGKISSINQVTGTAILTTNDGPINIWWRNDFRFAPQESGTIDWSADKTLTDPTYHQYTRPFPAKEGDTIEYRGIETHGEIMLTKIAIKPAHP